MGKNLSIKSSPELDDSSGYIAEPKNPVFFPLVLWSKIFIFFRNKLRVCYSASLYPVLAWLQQQEKETRYERSLKRKPDEKAATRLHQ